MVYYLYSYLQQQYFILMCETFTLPVRKSLHLGIRNTFIALLPLCQHHISVDIYYIVCHAMKVAVFVTRWRHLSTPRLVTVVTVSRVTPLEVAAVRGVRGINRESLHRL